MTEMKKKKKGIRKKKMLVVQGRIKRRNRRGGAKPCLWIGIRKNITTMIHHQGRQTTQYYLLRNKPKRTQNRIQAWSNRGTRL